MIFEKPPCRQAVKIQYIHWGSWQLEMESLIGGIGDVERRKGHRALRGSQIYLMDIVKNMFSGLIGGWSSTDLHSLASSILTAI
ncbi:hypothetical protein ANO14919_029920 [Xylariales sp. No.14919]|nr:hypothetical protein ANO14919_029920 [Xylariales sp. No.14919]